MFTEVITDRKRAEEELCKRDEWLRLGAEGSHLGRVVPGRSGKVIVLGWSNRQMFGVPPDAEITLEAFYETLHPNDLERVKQTWQHALDSATPYRVACAET